MTAAVCVAPRCDQEALEEVGEGALRPGGLALTARALALCAVGAGARVLDLGCGTAVTVRHLRRTRSLRALGIDLAREPLRRGLQRSALPLVQGAGSELPLAGGSVDLVLAECSLSLMPDGALAECWRVLVPGGRLAATDLYAREPRVECGLGSPPAACGARLATRQELTGRLEAHGFRVEAWEDHSRTLAQYAARAILAGGSLQAAWDGGAGCAGEASPTTGAVRRARPGYFLLVARKVERGEP